jgi:hypothetical protein
MRSDRLEPRFVESIPDELDPGYLYISIRFRTAQHLCACGCGSRIVTPIKPAKYSLTYDGETVSMWPSVGNWQKPCRSHYVVKNGRVVWHANWTDAQIARGRARDEAALRDYYASQPDDEQPAQSGGENATPATLRARVAAWFRGLLHD